MKTVILKIPNNSISKYIEPQINADERRFVNLDIQRSSEVYPKNDHLISPQRAQSSAISVTLYEKARFRVNSLNQWGKGSGSITLNGKTKAMHYEMSDEPIVAMKVKPVKYRTCIAGCRGRLYEDKTCLSKGVLVWKE